jgi:hypothetical protein
MRALVDYMMRYLQHKILIAGATSMLLDTCCWDAMIVDCHIRDEAEGTVVHS